MQVMAFVIIQFIASKCIEIKFFEINQKAKCRLFKFNQLNDRLNFDKQYYFAYIDMQFYLNIYIK